MKQFWMVWNSAGSRPREKHDTPAAAFAEAERIAAKHPGAEVHVLQTVGYFAIPTLRPEFVPISEGSE